MLRPKIRQTSTRLYSTSCRSKAESCQTSKSLLQRPFHSIHNSFYDTLKRRSYPFVQYYFPTSGYLKGHTYIRSHSTTKRALSSRRSSQTDKDTSSSIITDSANSSSSSSSSSSSFSAIVNRVHRRIPKIEWHISDLVSVLGIGILFVSILVLPGVVEYVC